MFIFPADVECAIHGPTDEEREMIFARVGRRINPCACERTNPPDTI